MPKYRVVSEQLRVINPDGSVYSLPPGTVLDEKPRKYEGMLEVVGELMVGAVGSEHFKIEHGYADKMIRPAEDKSL